MLLSAESLYAISSASTLMNATTARPVGGTPLSASLAQAKSWTTTACLMKNHLCWRGPLYTLALLLQMLAGLGLLLASLS